MLLGETVLARALALWNARGTLRGAAFLIRFSRLLLLPIVVPLRLLHSRFDRSQKLTEANFHKDTLEELNRSFQTEVQPMVVAVEGRTVKLTGTVEEQYDEWRRLLRELYEAETDMSRDFEIRIQEGEASAPPTSPPQPEH